MAIDRKARLDTTVVLMDRLLDDVANGELRVPAFQRPFEWRPEQMLDLFDSIEMGYPIGTLLLWQTDEPISTMERIGDVAVPSDRRAPVVSYVLDGHQRLSTLFGTLRRAASAPRSSEQRDWKWWIYRDLTAEQSGDLYRHHRPRREPPEEQPAHFLPLRAVSRTMDFLDFCRMLELRPLDGSRLEQTIRKAEAIANKIKNYQIALVRLIGGDLDQAVEVYTRLNRKGLRMDADQMVSALTFPRNSGRPSLANRIDDIIAGVAETGFGVIPRQAVFRAVLAIAGEQDVMSPRWEAVAGRLENKLHDAVPATERAVRDAVEFLRTVVGLPFARFLPYAHQLMLLTYFFQRCPSPTERQQVGLRQWFWVTSWANTFAGANSTMLRHALADLGGFATEGPLPALELDRVQPIPETFNLNSARTRAYITWELKEFPDRLDASGTPIEILKLLAATDSQVFRPVVEGNPAPANRLILPTPPGITVRKALTQAWSSDPQKVLDSHGIPRTARDRLFEGDGAGFVRDRTAFLKQRLQAFAGEVGIPLGRELIGEADDDTE